MFALRKYRLEDKSGRRFASGLWGLLPREPLAKSPGSKGVLCAPAGTVRWRLRKRGDRQAQGVVLHSGGLAGAEKVAMQGERPLGT